MIRVAGHSLRAINPRNWGEKWPGCCRCGADPPGDVMKMTDQQLKAWHYMHKTAVASEHPELTHISSRRIRYELGTDE